MIQRNDGDTEHHLLLYSALLGFRSLVEFRFVVGRLQSEMNTARANWEFTDYGSTVHAFTVPTLPREGDRVAYNPIADVRSWESMRAFADALFSDDVVYNACAGEAR